MARNLTKSINKIVPSKSKDTEIAEAADTQDGILFARIFQGSTDSEAFEDFIEHLLPSCGR